MSRRADRSPVAEADVDIDRSPARFSAWLTVGAAAFVILAVGRTGVSPLLFGVVGGLFVITGLALARAGAVTVGSGLLLCAVVSAGVVDAPTRPLLAGGAATVVVWDLGRTAIVLGAQVGRTAPTLRVELLHATVSVLVAAASASVAYAAAQVVAGGQPVVALVALLLAGVVFSFLLR